MLVCLRYAVIMNDKDIPKHHTKQELCTSRPSYRDGRRLTTVKVYTVHQESRYLLVQNVPAVGAREQLCQTFSAFGAIESLHPLDDYPAEDFTEVYLVKFQRIQSARFAKKKLDDQSFFGGSLHISYAPEYETVRETREKLQDRRKIIAAKIRQLEDEDESPPAKVSQTVKISTTVQGDNQRSLPPTQELLSLPPPPAPSHPSYNPSILPPPPPSLPPPPHIPYTPSLSQPPPPLSLPPPSAFHGSDKSSSGTTHSWSADERFLTPGGSRGQNSAANPLAGRTGVHHHGVTPNNLPGQYANSEGREEEAAGFVFTIPPPPMPGVSFDARDYRTPHHSRRDYGFAWVPSANATFPPGYDARLSQERDSGSGNEEGHVSRSFSEEAAGRENDVKAPSLSNTVNDNRLIPSSSSNAISGSQPSPSNTLVSRQTRSKSDNQPVPTGKLVRLSGKRQEKVLVREYTPKGPAPRFVPRQLKTADAGTDSTSAGTGGAARAAEDQVNREIRKEAFRLGDDQGPGLPSDPEARKELLGQRPVVEPSVEASVVSSVKAIRKRLSKFISETVPKKVRLDKKDGDNGIPRDVDSTTEKKS